MTDLQKLQDELAALQAAKEVAVETEAKLESEFWNAVINHPALMIIRNEQKEAVTKRDTAKKAFDARRAEISKELSAHFKEHPEDKNMVTAFDFRNEKSIDRADTPAVVDALIANNMRMMLQPTPYFFTFVGDLAAQSTANKWYLSTVLSDWLGGVVVTNTYKPQISNAKLVVGESEDETGS